MLENLNLFWSNNTGAIDVKMEGSVFEEILSSKMLRLFVSFNLNGAFALFLLIKMPPRKLNPRLVLST